MTWSPAGERVVAREPSMARSWVGLTMVVCLPCMAMLRSREAHNSYVNCQKTEECYEYAIMSRKNLWQARPTPTLHHKGHFAYEYGWETPGVASDTHFVCRRHVRAYA